MPTLKPKKDGENYVWIDGKPVFTNSDTGGDVEVDVPKMFADNKDLREENKTKRETIADVEKDRDGLKAQLGEWGELKPKEVTASMKELEGLKTGDKVTVRPPNEAEIEAEVKRTSGPRIEELEQQLEAANLATEKSNAGAAALTSALHVQFKRVEIDSALDQVERLDPGARQDAKLWLEQDFQVESLDEENPLKMRLVKKDENDKVQMGTDMTSPLSVLEHCSSLVRGEKKRWLLPPDGSPHWSKAEGGEAGDTNRDAPVGDQLEALFAGTPLPG